MDHDCLAVPGEGGSSVRVWARTCAGRAADEQLGDLLAVFRYIPTVWYRCHNGIPQSTGTNLGEKLLGGLVGRGDVDLIDTVPREDLTVDEDVTSLAPRSRDVLLDPAGVLVECERIVGASLRGFGCDPDVVRHAEILRVRWCGCCLIAARVPLI
jgi:hypothetical protein